MATLVGGEACPPNLKNKGYSRQYVLPMTMLGHGVGLEHHDGPPIISEESEDVLESGMTMALEPIIIDFPEYKAGFFASEENVLVTEKGHEVLAKLPRDLWITDQSARA